MGDRLLAVALLVKSEPEIVVARDRIRLRLEDPPILCDGLGQIALRVQRPCKIEARRDGMRVERQCLLTVSNSHLEMAERLMDAGDIVMEFRNRRVQRNRPADLLQRHFRPAGLKHDQAEKVPAIGVVRIGGDNPPVKPFRRGEPSGVMVPGRFRQQRRDRRV